MIVTDGHDAPEQEEQAVQMLADRQCDAIVLYTRYMSEKAIIKLMNTVQTPLVVINREVSQAPDRCVFFEQQDAAFKAVDYLINQGHREIACITVPIHTPTGKARLMGYRKALEKHGIRLDERRIKYGDAGMTRGYELCKELIADGVPFSALFACNDDMHWVRPKRCTRQDSRSRRISPCSVLTMPQARSGWSLRFHRFICQ